MKLKEKEAAVIRRKRGESVREISTALGVSKSTVSLWLRDISLSSRAQNILKEKYTLGQRRGQAARRAQTTKNLNNAVRQAKVIISKFPDTPSSLMVVCALMYWCEGQKSKIDNAFMFANSDPSVITTFLKLFRSSFQLDEQKFRVCIHLHAYHDDKKQLQFWSKMTKIPLSQFIKPCQKAHTGKQTREGYQGCAQIRYHDATVARQLQAVARVFLNKYGPIV